MKKTSSNYFSVILHLLPSWKSKNLSVNGIFLQGIWTNLLRNTVKLKFLHKNYTKHKIGLHKIIDLFHNQIQHINVKFAICEVESSIALEETGRAAT